MATRDELREAYAKAVKAKGVDAAVDCIAKITGNNFLSRVPDAQIDAVIHELSSPRSLASIHNSLGAIGKKAFARK